MPRRYSDDDEDTRETKRGAPSTAEQEARVEALVREQRERDELVAAQVADDELDQEISAAFDVSELSRILSLESRDASDEAALQDMCGMWLERKAEKERWSKGLAYAPLIKKAHRKIVWHEDTPVFGADISDGHSEFRYINSDGELVVMTFTLSLSKSDVCVGKDYLFVSDKEKHIEYVHWTDNLLRGRQVEHTAIAEARGNLYYAFDKAIYLFDPIRPLINMVCTVPYRIDRLAMHDDMIVYSTRSGVVQQWSLCDQCRVCGYQTRNTVTKIAISAGFVYVRTPTHMLFFRPIDEIMDKTMLPNRQVEIEFKENEIALGYNDGSFIVSNNLTLYRMGIEGTQTLGSDRFIDASFSKSGKLGVLGESFYGENKAS
jgi:hypothetical protein